MEDIKKYYGTKKKNLEPKDHRPIMLTNVGYTIFMSLVKD